MNTPLKSFLVCVACILIFSAGYLVATKQSQAGRYASHFDGGALSITDTATGEVRIIRVSQPGYFNFKNANFGSGDEPVK